MQAETYRQLGQELEQTLSLRDVPVALKVLYKGDEIPADALRPSRDTGRHYAMCQAMMLARRGKKTVALLKEDNWCLWPVISFGMVKLDEGDMNYLGGMHFYKDTAVSHKYFREEYPILKTDRDVDGFMLAPLTGCSFEPDIVCIYCRPGQLRSLLMAAKYESGQVVSSSLDTCASCVHAVIPVLNSEKPYNLSIPDPGEYERSLCDEDEMIFTLRADRLEEVVTGMRMLSRSGFGYRQLAPDMNLDYPRPEFYANMFEKWGLERGPLWAPRV
jgi:uncharacterized protein (DUF169 family)